MIVIFWRIYVHYVKNFIYSNELPAEPAKIEPFNLVVEAEKWRVPSNRLPPRPQSALKQAELVKTLDMLKKGGIMEPSCQCSISLPDAGVHVSIRISRLYFSGVATCLNEMQQTATLQQCVCVCVCVSIIRTTRKYKRLHSRLTV